MERMGEGSKRSKEGKREGEEMGVGSRGGEGELLREEREKTSR